MTVEGKSGGPTGWWWVLREVERTVVGDLLISMSWIEQVRPAAQSCG